MGTIQNAFDRSINNVGAGLLAGSVFQQRKEEIMSRVRKADKSIDENKAIAAKEGIDVNDKRKDVKINSNLSLGKGKAAAEKREESAKNFEENLAQKLQEKDDANLQAIKDQEAEEEAAALEEEEAAAMDPKRRIAMQHKDQATLNKFLDKVDRRHRAHKLYRGDK